MLRWQVFQLTQEVQTWLLTLKCLTKQVLLSRLQFNGHMEERYIMTGGELFWAINTYNLTLSAFHQGCQGTKSAALHVTWSSAWLWTLLRAVSRRFSGHARHEIQTLQPQIHFHKTALFIVCDSQQPASPGNKLNSPSAHCYSACVWLPWFCWLEHQFLP